MFEDERLLTIIGDVIFRTYSYDWGAINVNENGANGLRVDKKRSRMVEYKKCFWEKMCCTKTAKSKPWQIRKQESFANALIV